VAVIATTDTEVIEPVSRDVAERLDKRMRLLVGTNK
jgi:hypothetical protein